MDLHGIRQGKHLVAVLTDIESHPLLDLNGTLHRLATHHLMIDISNCTEAKPSELKADQVEKLLSVIGDAISRTEAKWRVRIVMRLPDSPIPTWPCDFASLCSTIHAFYRFAASESISDRIKTAANKVHPETITGADDFPAVQQAVTWTDEASIALRRHGLTWVEPHCVTCTTSKEVVFEWWFKDRKLTLYFDGNSVQFIKVWGPDTHDEMTDGVLVSVPQFILIWQWAFIDEPI